MSQIRFRIATPDDVQALVSLVTSAYRGESSRTGWTTEADLLDGERLAPEVLLADIKRPGSYVIIAERPGDSTHELVACAHVAEDNGAGYFGMFAVRPWLQGHGIGQAVLAEAERVVSEELGLERLRMTVIDVRLELIAWYERRGYQRTGEYQPFPYGDTRFGTPRRDDLRFAVLEKALA
ncbi:N-acetyltransferase [Kushneria pakistanensis]|uniref:N-acetyltransferase n=1 Tax=Kushneria pakistanensis TaxID=1508770 RepID=A0ABQ3FI38_9GAMM|nr:GNAT family N-acetyltransferase [Kushneria pakistanensis]GHC24128.1 N-acetyltransferase [Kushneria pakistanensis]